MHNTAMKHSTTNWTARIAAWATVLASWAITAPAYAHVKWFVEDAELDVEPFRLTDPAVLVWLGVIVVVTGVGIVLERRAVVGWVQHLAHDTRWHRVAEAVFRVLVAGWLIYSAGTGTVFVPVFATDGVLGAVSIVWQVVLALVVLSYRWDRVASVLLVGLYIVASATYGWLDVLEHAFVLGIAAWLGLGGSLRNAAHPTADWAIPALRVATGVSLIVLGLQEKLLHPELSLAFLDTHPWNFMQALGFEWFTNQLFVLSAGMTELLFGWIFVLGVVTRLNTLVLAVFFITTIIVLGPQELTGHLPLFAIVALLLVHGSGNQLRVVEPQQAQDSTRAL